MYEYCKRQMCLVVCVWQSQRVFQRRRRCLCRDVSNEHTTHAMEYVNVSRKSHIHNAFVKTAECCRFVYTHTIKWMLTFILVEWCAAGAAAAV